MDSGMEAKLKRSLNLFSLTLYGIGSIIGAGIYVIVGKVADYSGMLTPLAFLLSALIASFSAMAFAELSSRYPQSAGEAVYVQKAFNSNSLAMLIGWLVVATGIVSTAALANGFAGYAQLFILLPDAFIKTIFVLALGSLAIWGIRESVFMIVLITLIEIGGLLLVIGIASTRLRGSYEFYRQLITLDAKSWHGITLGAFVAFYAFIGFEDIVNVAEEVKNPRKTIAQSLLLSVAISSILYIALSFFAVTSMPLAELVNSDAPMAKIIEHAGYSTVAIGLIGLITVMNGALVNIIMASRVIYGMAKLKVLPAFFGRVHLKTQTPHIATLFSIVLILCLALLLPILTLAKLTSFIMLVVYFFVNLALVVIKIKQKTEKVRIRFPIVFPILGMTLTLVFLGIQFFLGLLS